MKTWFRGFALLPLVLLAAGCPAPKAPPPPPSPALIKSFTADRPRVSAGETVTLSFETEGATEVTLTDEAGQPIATTGEVSKGEATVTPAKSSIYLLKAKGEGGQDAAFVQVAVGESLKEVFFVAVPSEIDAGGEAQLVFSAFRSTEVTITSSTGAPVTVSGESGVVTVKPGFSTRYTFQASGGSGPAITAEAQVKVRPVIGSFSATPPAARSGEKILLSWTTGGADRLTLEEGSFGELFTSSSIADVASGQFEWTVPGDLPGIDGGALPDGGTPTPTMPTGFPLRFTLKASAADPAVTVSRTLSSYAGDGPRIDVFSAPASVTGATRFSLEWKTTNAVRVQVYADGLLVYEPLPGNLGAAASGSLGLVAPTKETTYELVAYSFQGLSVRRSQKVSVVKPPQALTFNLPASVGAPGDSATASWTTQDAIRVQIQVKAGPVTYFTDAPAKVASGTASVYPGVKTTFVLVATNAAGDSATLEKTVDVGAPATASATPNLITQATPVKLAWDFSGLSATEVLGLPFGTPTSVAASTNFFDLALEPTAVPAAFAETNDAVAALPGTAGFTFPFVGGAYGKFWVSTNGFLSFFGANPLPTNADLSLATAAAPAMLAPFWDDLELGTGQVYYLVDGSEFPRRLTVQWNEVSIAGDPASKLTFQVQLFESGDFKFIYQTLQDTNNRSKGESATVGVRQAADKFTAGFSFDPGAAAVAEDQELIWFSGLPSTGEVTVKTDDSTLYSFFYRTGGGNLVSLALPVRAFAAGSLSVSEAMPVPEAAAVAGAWIELQNNRGTEQDLSMLELSTTTSTANFVLPEGTTIPANGFLVLGQSLDPLENGGANVTLAWGAGDLPMTADDTVSLIVPGTTPVTISTLAYAAAVAGSSVQSPEKAITTTGAPVTCTRIKTFGTNGAIGTPGANNENCFQYLLNARPLSYLDISGSGTPLFTAIELDQDVVTLSLAAAPFPYFGVSQSEVQVSTNGFVAFKTSLTTYYDSNKSMPSTTEPFGIASIFWDDLDGTAATGSNVYSKRIAAGEDPANPGAHWIIQWHRYTHWNADDDLNFQMKLFDSGVIEYHYATMVSGSTSNYATGASATVWLDTPTGEAARYVTINNSTSGTPPLESTPIQPNSAFAFTPQ